MTAFHMRPQCAQYDDNYEIANHVQMASLKKTLKQ